MSDKAGAKEVAHILNIAHDMARNRIKEEFVSYLIAMALAYLDETHPYTPCRDA